MEKKKDRESGIECLKIVAVFLIVLSHTTQTLTSVNGDLSVAYQNYVLDVTCATTQISNLILAALRYLGAFGNTIFFICSAWFLVDSKRADKKKWFFMLVNIWVVSMLILGITFLLRSGDISGKLILTSVFPTTFMSNWYMTCYLVFYLLHPVLNILLAYLDQKTHFRISLVMFVLYFGFAFIRDTFYFYSSILLWITIYFIVAYLKTYCRDVMDSRKGNLWLIGGGIALYLGLLCVTNIVGLHWDFMNDKLLYWAQNNNPFLLMIALGLFNLARQIHFTNHAINHLSKLTLLIYIIHENRLLRTYYRSALIKSVYLHYGYEHVILWDLFLAVIIFLFAVIVSFIYEQTLQKLVKKMSDWLFKTVRDKYLVFERCCLK